MPVTPSPTAAARQIKARRHQYVPQMLQRHFSGVGLHLWSFDRRYPEHGVERRPIARLFREWHFDMVQLAVGARDTSTKTRLSAIEGQATPVIAHAIAAARAGRAPNFTTGERQALIDLFAAQHRPTPGFHRQVLPSRYEARVRHDAIAETATDPLAHVTASLMGRGLSVGRVTAPRCGFVLGNTPLAQAIAPGRRKTLGDPRVEVWLPIAPDVALLSYGAAGESLCVDLGSSNAVGRINGLIVGYSTVIASPSRHLVQALTQRVPCGIALQGWEPL